MDAALSHLRSQGAELKPEDVARLSPLAVYRCTADRYAGPLREACPRRIRASFRVSTRIPPQRTSPAKRGLSNNWTIMERVP